LGKLTPAVLKASKKAQIPIVHRISDYSLICLNSIQHDGEKICEECNKSFLNGIRKKCFRSYLNSSIQYLIRKFLYLSNLHKNINCFVSPSQNTIELLKKNNYYKNANFAYLPTFSNINFNLSSEILENRFKNKKFVYWGRISPEKDFSLLLKAFKELNCTGYNLKLDIVGFDESAFSKQLITQIKNENLEDVITTHNFMSDSTMAKIREEAFVYLFPSKIYDNLPQSVIESLSLGIPVIASDLGSLKELIIDKYNGFLYLPNSVDSLFNAIIKSTESFDLYKKMAENALKHVQNKYSEKLHLTRLMEVFQENIKTQ